MGASGRSAVGRWLRPALSWSVVLTAMALLVMWLSGAFGQTTEPRDQPGAAGAPVPAGAATVVASSVEVPVVEEAIGTIRAVQEVAVASRLLARIRAMHVRAAGQVVAAGEVLVELEDQDLRARLAEAQAAERAAIEERDQAQRELARTRDLHAQQIASDRDLERAGTAAAAATAAVERARQNAEAAAALLEFSVLRAPIGGVVIDKLREQGDTVAPGDVVVTLYDPSRMQLVASVRESLATALRVGAEVAVRIDALELDCHGTVAEIVPQAAAQSRAFDVKVTGPCPEGVFSGMFGRLFLATGTRTEVRVPVAAVRSFGQVDQVLVVQGGRMLRRFVVPGGRRGDEVAILSGLAAGERVLADPAALRGAAR